MKELPFMMAFFVNTVHCIRHLTALTLTIHNYSLRKYYFLVLLQERKLKIKKIIM